VDFDIKKTVFISWPFEKIKINFINSVTRRPVEINFRPIFYFSSFQMNTDKETEAYYTRGVYEIQEELKKEIRKSMVICSEKGIMFCVGEKCHEVKDGCAKIRLVWPP